MDPNNKSRRRLKLNRRNALKHIDYDATTTSSDYSSHSPLHTRSLDLSDRTSFCVEGNGGDTERICAELGLFGPDDFAIPEDAWEARKNRSTNSDVLPMAKLYRLDIPRYDPNDEPGHDEVSCRDRDCLITDPSEEAGHDEVAELCNRVRDSFTVTSVTVMAAESSSSTSTSCSNVRVGIKGARPPGLKPPPGLARMAVVDDGCSTWDLFRDFAPVEEKESSELVQRRFGPSSSSEEEEEEDYFQRRNVVVEEEEEEDYFHRRRNVVVEIRERVASSGGCSFTTSYGDSFSTTTTDLSYGGISPNGRPKPVITYWERGDLLGSGSFGSVYEGISDGGCFIAVKEVSLLDQGSLGRQRVSQLEQEIALLSQFEHENIVQYYGTQKDESKLYIFLEFVTKGSLQKLYNTYHLTDSHVSVYTRQILQGLKYLHDRNVIHRDIKCANLLVHANGSVKLADFGLAETTKLNDIKSCKGTAYWMAPEVVNRKSQGYGLPADIWSLGCTVLEMLTGLVPYSNLELMQVLWKIGKGEPPLVPDSLSSEAQDFIHLCLQVKPDKRPTAAQLLRHPFVNKVFPGDEIPEWFSTISKRNPISMEIPHNLGDDSKWKGFAACAIFSVKGNTALSLIELDSNFSNYSYQITFETDVERLKPELEVLECNGLNLGSTSHLLMVFNISSLTFAQRGLFNKSTMVRAIFETTNPYMVVQKCGIRLVYEQDAGWYSKIVSGVVPICLNQVEDTAFLQESAWLNRSLKGEKIIPPLEEESTNVCSTSSFMLTTSLGDPNEKLISSVISLPESLELKGYCPNLEEKSVLEDEYGSLPEQSKRLFLYCSLFPSNYEFRRDELVQMWIAEGFVDEVHRGGMEDIGVEYFMSLLKRGFLVPSRCDYRVDFDSIFSVPIYNPGHLLYKVNPLQFSCLGSAIPQDEYFVAANGRLDGALEMTQRLSLICKDVDDMTFGALKKFKHMRTLILAGCGSSINCVPRDLFLRLKELRTLNLSQTLVSELPSSIRNLKSLRYLDLSNTRIARLPESIDSLHTLQTIRLRGCVHFHQLPKGMKKLVNLRHIDLDIIRQLRSMPSHLGSLTSLQTLSAYLVGRVDGCRIGELKNLNNLRGVLRISRLENVESKEEAEEAALADKKWLQRLELRWSTVHNEKKAEQEQIIECLKPHTGVRELLIQHYAGSKLPTWISNPCFAELVVLTFYRCKNCALLPSIGQLPMLKSLSIVEMNEVREINYQFLGDRNPFDQGCHAFLKLEILEVDTMLSLKEWKDVNMGDFPSLLKLTVDSCPELTTLPSLSWLKSLKHLEFRRCPNIFGLPNDGLPASLESFIVIDCPELKEWCRLMKGEDWRNICHLPSIWLDCEEVRRLKD